MLLNITTNKHPQEPPDKKAKASPQTAKPTVSSEFRTAKTFSAAATKPSDKKKEKKEATSNAESKFRRRPEGQPISTKLHENEKLEKVKFLEGSASEGSHDNKVITTKTSSLFKHNPEIPHVELGFVKPKKEPLFSSVEFSDLDIHPYLVACLRDRIQITKMTTVQQRTIPLLLEGKDCLVKSATGSGKTLAFAVPIVQSLQAIKPNLHRSDGIHALIIVPTRELAVQCYEFFSTLCRAFAWLVPGCLMGGEKKKSEKARIRKGMTILISTPGRLLDHLKSTSNLSLKKIRWFVIDEADRLLDLGFEKAISEIVAALSEQNETGRQTVLLSATLTKGVEKLAGMSLTNPAIVDLGAQSEEASMAGDSFIVPSCLKQHFIITPIKLRLVTLSAFFVDKCSAGDFKALVFMMTQDMVDYHYSLFTDVLQDAMSSSGLDITFFRLHGNMNQQERVEVFNSFRETRSGILLCTDVAARGLDLPRVDWIIQYSAPTRPEDYVHRVGRTARIGSEGHALLFLVPSEVNFIDVLQQHRIQVDEMDMNKLLTSVMLLAPSNAKSSKGNLPHTVEEHATWLQLKYENCVYEHQALLESARKAYTSYVRAYASYPLSLRNVFPFKSLHLGHVAKSMCLREAPTVLGHKQAMAVQKQAKKKPPQVKRKQNFEVSEYDSGLNFGKKRKH